MAAAVDGNWSYAVPMDEHTGFAQPQPTDTFKSRDSAASGYRELRSSSQRRPSNYSVPIDNSIMSDSETAGSRRASIRASHAAASRKRSRNALRDKRKEEKPDNVDDSAWIHRDKLAQIEIQEMEEAGIHVRQSRRSTSAGPDAEARNSRSVSRSGVRRPMSKESFDGENGGPLYASFDDYQRKRVSTIPAADEEEYEPAFDPNRDSELRTPEEVAAEQQVYKQHMIRPSTSRLPIAKASPVPVPQQVVGRDSPLPRSRAGSGAYSGNWDEMQYARRARSNSIGSQVLLDDVDGMQISGSRPASSHLRNSDENSSPRARVPSKTTPTSVGRKTSATANGTPRPTSSHLNKPRTPSGANKRPTSSSGHKSRPSTSHAPEGEAPWIATMYKPDPRLPPDQQLLPTHAKKLMQEQWQKDGKTGTAYDRDFNLLNDKEFQQAPAKAPKLETNGPTYLNYQQNGALSPQPSPQTEIPSPAGSNNNKPWPLSPSKSDTKSETGSVRPGTSGGYKITPTIAAPPPIQRSPNSNQSVTADAQASSVPHNATPRVPDYDEKELVEEKKKSCGCCIVM